MYSISLRWRHYGRDSVSNNQPHDCLLNRFCRRRAKKTSKHRVTGLCARNSPAPGDFSAQRPVTRKIFPFDDVIMIGLNMHEYFLFLLLHLHQFFYYFTRIFKCFIYSKFSKWLPRYWVNLDKDVPCTSDATPKIVGYINWYQVTIQRKNYTLFNMFAAYCTGFRKLYMLWSSVYPSYNFLPYSNATIS